MKLRSVLAGITLIGAAISVLPGATNNAPGAAAAAAPAHASDLAAFFDEVDRTYPFFELKGIRSDWEATKQRLTARLSDCGSDAAFLGIVLDAIRCLRDAHMSLRSEKVELQPLPARYYPGISFLPASDNRVVLLYPPREHAARLKTGTLVTHIDGQEARRMLEARGRAAWEAGGFFSSPQRARLFEYRIPLRGERGEAHRITFLVDGKEWTTTLRSTVEARGWPRNHNMPAGLERVGRSLHFTKLSGGAGYMYVRRVDGSVEPGVARATASHPDAAGWILDLRGNSGGGYGRSLLAAIQALPRPVAVLIDAGCASAGETLARDIRRLAGARLFGSPTAGSSSSKRTWAFPSGLAVVKLSTRSRWRGDRQPIEFNGVDPDVTVEAVPEELIAGRNSAIRRAEAWLAQQGTP